MPSKELWNGEVYANFSTDRNSRHWDDARRYSFLSGGGTSRNRQAIQNLRSGERVWVKISPYGFVGVGLVNGEAQSAIDFKVMVNGLLVPILEVTNILGNYRRSYKHDFNACEYFVPMIWLDTVPLTSAVADSCGYQSTVCRPTKPAWDLAVTRLKKKFLNFDKV